MDRVDPRRKLLRVVAGALLCAPLLVFLFDAAGFFATVDPLVAAVVLALVGVALLMWVIGGPARRRIGAGLAGLAWCALQIVAVILIAGADQL